MHKTVIIHGQGESNIDRPFDRFDSSDRRFDRLISRNHANCGKRSQRREEKRSQKRRKILHTPGVGSNDHDVRNRTTGKEGEGYRNSGVIKAVLITIARILLRFNYNFVFRFLPHDFLTAL